METCWTGAKLPTDQVRLYTVRYRPRGELPTETGRGVAAKQVMLTPGGRKEGKQLLQN